MTILELFFVAVGVSMDAFAAAICKGLSLHKANLKSATTVGLYFGIFQAGMPLIGYTLGVQFQDKIAAIDHWLAFILLGAVGLSLIGDSRDRYCEVPLEDFTGKKMREALGFKKMSVLAIATSIDALAVGVTFAFLDVDIVPAVSFIGVTTFLFSIVGVYIGNAFGVKYKSKAEFAGGLILILMGFHILLQHLGVI